MQIIIRKVPNMLSVFHFSSLEGVILLLVFLIYPLKGVIIILISTGFQLNTNGDY